jgi:hypothetical protein
VDGDGKLLLTTPVGLRKDRLRPGRAGRHVDCVVVLLLIQGPGLEEAEVEGTPQFTGRFQYPPLSSHDSKVWTFVLVNGVIWPKAQVEPRQYRLRMLNGSNSRTYRLKLLDDQSVAPTSSGTADHRGKVAAGAHVERPSWPRRTTGLAAVRESLVRRVMAADLTDSDGEVAGMLSLNVLANRPIVRVTGIPGWASEGEPEASQDDPRQGPPQGLRGRETSRKGQESPKSDRCGHAGNGPGSEKGGRTQRRVSGKSSSPFSGCG